MKLRNVNPLGDVELPLLGRVGDHRLRAGEEFDCPADLAGRAPGEWRAPTEAELADNLAGLERRTVGEAPNLRCEVKSPGIGLLAQVTNFVLAERDPLPVKKTATPAANVEGK